MTARRDARLTRSIRRVAASLLAPTCAAALSLCEPPIALAQIPDHYPKPLVHTAQNHPAQHALLLVVDGLHAFDLANWVAAHPQSTLAQLSRRGVTYTNASSPFPNSTAGLLAIVTGGTPISTGILAADGFDRILSPPGSACAPVGAPLQLDRMLPSGAASSSAALDPAHGCSALPPHALLRVNTIFEVIHEKIGPTAWAASTPALTDLPRGPSGKGLDTVCASPPDADNDRVNFVLHWIVGRDCSGVNPIAVPALFGIQFTAIARATPAGASIDARGTPSPQLDRSLAAVDASIGRIVAALQQHHLYDTTWIYLTSAYGNPLRAARSIPLASLVAVANTAQPKAVLYSTGGSTAMLWLRDRTTAAHVAQTLAAHAAELGIDAVIDGPRLQLTLPSDPADPRLPDILLRAREGILWTAQDRVEPCANGLGNGDETHVALLVSGAQLSRRNDPTPVPITQIAPLLLRSLGLEKFDLDALHHEHTPALPGIF